MSKRSNTYGFYTRPQNLTGYGLADLRTTTIEDLYKFKGNQFVWGLVVRADLNGYSKWASGVEIGERVTLLNDFFTKTLTSLEKANGIYFRDEGDCIVAIFSNYFRSYTSNSVLDYCRSVIGQTYGSINLSAKCCVASGGIAIYQKSHEQGTEDWSAEGAPFVNCHRLETVVDSQPMIYFFNDDNVDKVYKDFFKPNINFVSFGEPAVWTANDNFKLQVPGLGQAGGWVDLATMKKK